MLDWGLVRILCSLVGCCSFVHTDNLNPMYVDRICELFRLPQMAGIVGGKPNASLFFVGIQDDQVWGESSVLFFIIGGRF